MLAATPATIKRMVARRMCLLKNHAAHRLVFLTHLVVIAVGAG
ncbi:MAG: hypothetical protein ACI9MR_000078 [Myxococcota bacterium]|jgi:hypothetical protein